MINLANVIFPAFATPYATAFLLPVAGICAVVTEVMVFHLLNKRLGLGIVVGLVIAVNIVSTVIGFIIADALPDGLVLTTRGEGVQQFIESGPGPLFLLYAILGYILALILSVVIEYGIVRLIIRSKIAKPFKTVTLANVAGYLALVAVSVIYALCR